MADGQSQGTVELSFGSVADTERTPGAPTAMSIAAGDALRSFFDAHPDVSYVQFEIALNEAGDDLEFAAGTLHAERGAPLSDGREARRAGEAFRRLLRGDPDVAALPVALVIAMEGLEHTFRIRREATGARCLTG
jgi:hypothetical protein